MSEPLNEWERMLESELEQTNGVQDIDVFGKLTNPDGTPFNPYPYAERTQKLREELALALRAKLEAARATFDATAGYRRRRPRVVAAE